MKRPMADFFPTWRTYRTFGAVHFIDKDGLEYCLLSNATKDDQTYVQECRAEEMLEDNDELLDYRIPISVRRGGKKREPYVEVGPETGTELKLMDPINKTVLFTCVVESISMHFEANEIRSGTRTIGRMKVNQWSPC